MKSHPVKRRKRLRLAYICADRGVPVFGRKGCSIHVQEVLRSMGKHASRITLFAANCDGARPSGLEAVRLHPLPRPSKVDPATGEKMSLAANRDLQAILKREGPFDLIYERYSIWSFAGMEYAQAAGIPGVLEVNAPLIDEQAEHRCLIDRPGAEQVAARTFGNAAALVAVSDEVGQYLEKFPLARGKIHIIPNGVNPERFHPKVKPSLPKAAENFTAGFVGTLKPWHGLATLADAFAQLHRRNPRTRLLMVGDGPERENILKHLTALGVAASTHFTGAVSPEEVPGLLASMDAAMAPYPKLPNFYFSPLKVLEYMAAGLPVVASRIGQLKQLIDHGENGLLVEPGDADTLAAALARLEREPELRSRLGRAARTKVRRRYTWDGAIRQILKLAGMNF